MKGLLLSDLARQSPTTFGIIDHFTGLDTTKFSTTISDLGSVAVGDAVGGVAVITPSDATIADNDESYLQSKEVFRIASQKPIEFAARVQFTQAATNAANILAGLMDAPTANALQDNGAGPKASFSGAAFYAYDGSVNWNVIYSDGATQTKAELTASNSLNKVANVAGSAAYQLLEISILPKTSTLCDVVFRINGSTVYKMLDRTYANATETAVAFGAKNGTAAQQVLNVDMVSCHQLI
jgi:hypothetical protein